MTLWDWTPKPPGKYLIRGQTKPYFFTVSKVSAAGSRQSRQSAVSSPPVAAEKRVGARQMKRLTISRLARSQASLKVQALSWGMVLWLTGVFYGENKYGNYKCDTYNTPTACSVLCTVCCLPTWMLWCIELSWLRHPDHFQC